MKIEAYGKQYSGGDITVGFLGDIPDGVKGIKFDYKQAKENLYQMGSRKPNGRLHKKEEYTCTLTVNGRLLDAMEKLAPEGKLTRLAPFAIDVTAKDDEELVLKHHLLSYCEVTGVSKGYTSENDEVVHDIEIIPGDIIAQ